MKKFTKQENGHEEDENLKKRQQFWRIMEVPNLSLAPKQGVFDKSMNGSLPETNLSRKRKCYSDNLFTTHDQPMIQTSTVDLQLEDPLPLDWEQCLDLQTGRRYYMNRKTLRKSWDWPKDCRKLDLELNMISSCYQECSGSEKLQDSKKKHSSSNSNMLALACSNCHLLVILSKSSPSCPNCKYVHSLPPPPQVPTTLNSLDTLSLLN